MAVTPPNFRTLISGIQPGPVRNFTIPKSHVEANAVYKDPGSQALLAKLESLVDAEWGQVSLIHPYFASPDGTHFYQMKSENLHPEIDSRSLRWILIEFLEAPGIVGCHVEAAFNFEGLKVADWYARPILKLEPTSNQEKDRILVAGAFHMLPGYEKKPYLMP